MSPGPIPFLKTPAALASQVADAQSSWSALASTTDQNFALINSWLTNGHPWPAVWHTRLTGQFNPPSQTDWTDVGATWPPISFPIPQGIRALLIIMSAQLETNPAKMNYVAVGAEMSDPGFTAVAPPEWTEVSSSGTRVGLSRWLVWPTGGMAVGQTATLTPVYRQTGVMTPINAHITVGDLYAIVLV
jgi:hypothetical protein